MARDAKINVSAPGADETAQDLRNVAGAARDVDDAAQQAAGGSAGAADAKNRDAQATRELDDRNRTLAERLRALGPEFTVVGDAVDSLTLKEGKAAMAIGAFGVAVLGLTMLYQRWQQASEESAQQMDAENERVAELSRTYEDLAASITEAQRSQAGYVSPAQAPHELARRVTRTVGRIGGLDEGGIEQAATTAAAAGRELSDEEMRLLVQWMATGRGEGLGAGREAWSAFAAAAGHDPMADRIREEFGRMGADNPQLRARQMGTARRAMAGYTPAGYARQVLSMMAEARADDDWETAEDVEVQVGELVRWSQQRHRPGTPIARRAQASRRRLGDLLEQYPELEAVRFDAGATEIDSPSISEYLGGQTNRRYAPAGRGQTIQQIINGGTHYHNSDKADPRGRNTPSGGGVD